MVASAVPVDTHFHPSTPTNNRIGAIVSAFFGNGAGFKTD